jgi:peptidoglycan/LPS O-acetylase OafA/YrhL
MRRVPELDAVRGLAALAIVVYHFALSWFPVGWAAVDLFFVLSGYLITAIILEHQESPRFLGRFYLRRGLRIWPIYYLSLLLLLVLGPFLPRPTDWGRLAAYLTYTQNVERYWSATPREFSWYFNHTWTLAIEEQFYLFWPVLVLLAGRRRVAPLALAVLSASVVARGCGVHWWTLLGRSDGLALGALLATSLRDRERLETWLAEYRRGIGLVAAVAAGYLAVVASRGGLPGHGTPLWPATTVLAINGLFLGVVGLVVLNSGKAALGWLRRPRLVYLGRISYGLYLYHMIVLRIKLDLCRTWRISHNFWIDAATIAASFALAALSWHFVEQPILALKDRFDYGESSPIGAPEPSLNTRCDPGHPRPEPSTRPLSSRLLSKNEA